MMMAAARLWSTRACPVITLAKHHCAPLRQLRVLDKLSNYILVKSGIHKCVNQHIFRAATRGKSV